MVMRFKVGIRFQRLGQDDGDTTNVNEDDKSICHWAVIIAPEPSAKWSLKIELARDADSGVTCPVSVFEEEVPSHHLGYWDGHLEDIMLILREHPMRRPEKYSSTYNNCQHWAATLLVFMEAYAKVTPKRLFHISYPQRYKRTLEPLAVDGSDLYHSPNWYFASAHKMSAGGGAAAVGTALVASEATVLVPASGIAGWFGATAAVPTATAVVASAALPFTVAAATIAGGTYVYNKSSWKKATLFKDPRKGTFPKTGSPLTKAEMGELLDSCGRSSGFVSVKKEFTRAPLLGAYVGTHVGAIAAAFSPGNAAIFAPLAAASISKGIWSFWS